MFSYQVILFYNKYSQNIVTDKKKNPEALVNKGFRDFVTSFPLHSAGGFGGDVVDDAVDAGDLVGDAA